jgi:hypothetical protein
LLKCESRKRHLVTRSNFIRSNFTRSNFIRLNFTRSNFIRLNFTRSNFIRLNFTRPKLTFFTRSKLGHFHKIESLVYQEFRQPRLDLVSILSLFETFDTVFILSLFETFDPVSILKPCLLSIC